MTHDQQGHFTTKQAVEAGYLLLVWDDGGDAERRYFEGDLEAVLFEPMRLPAASKARLGFRLACPSRLLK